MFELMNLLFPSSPEDEGGSGKKDDADESDKDTGNKDDVDEDNVDDEPDPEEVERARKAAIEQKYKERSKKRDKANVELSNKVTALESKISDLISSLEEVKTNKKSKPKSEDKETESEVTKVLSTLLDKVGSLESKIQESSQVAAKEREVAARREFLTDMGASRGFIRKIDQGFINIPDTLWEDNLDGLHTFIEDLNGFDVKATKVADAGGNGKPKRTVPHKSVDDTSAVHADKKSKAGMEETVAAVNKGIDDVFKKAKKEGKPLDVDDLTELYKLADKLDK